MSVPHHRSGSVNTPKASTSDNFDTVPFTNSNYSTAAMMRNSFMDPSSMDMPMTSSYFSNERCGSTKSSMYSGDDDFAMYSGAPRTRASMYGMDGMHAAMTAASMYDESERSAMMTAASMYDRDSVRSARTAASMYDEAVMRAARTAASMYDEPEIRAFSNPYSQRGSVPTTAKSFRSCPVTKSPFPKPLFPSATTASAFGEYWE